MHRVQESGVFVLGGDVVLEAGRGKGVKRQTGGQGRKISKSTKDDGERNQDVNKKQKTNKTPQRVEESRHKEGR